MTPSLKIVFAGTPEFALPPLQALIDSHHQVLSVYTQPDRPAGRGRQLQASPVKQLALAHHLPVCQPQTLKSTTAIEGLHALQPDIMVVVAYGLLLPREVLEIPPLGCINIHASLLPRWRGAAPIQRAILAGDAQSGVTLMQMAQGLDTGDILVQAPMRLALGQTSQDLHDRMAQMGADTLIESLEQIRTGKISRCPQDEVQANYAAKLSKSEAWIDWRLAADAIVRQVCAFNPWPVAQTHYECGGKRQILRVWRAQCLSDACQASFGQIVCADKNGIAVSSGDGLVRLLEVQRSGGKRMSAADYVNAHDLQDVQFLSPPDAN